MLQKASDVVGVPMRNVVTANGAEGKALIVAEVITPKVDPPPCFRLSHHILRITGFLPALKDLHLS
jgi:hypothetical protein